MRCGRGRKVGVQTTTPRRLAQNRNNRSAPVSHVSTAVRIPHRPHAIFVAASGPTVHLMFRSGQRMREIHFDSGALPSLSNDHFEHSTVAFLTKAPTEDSVVILSVGRTIRGQSRSS